MRGVITICTLALATFSTQVSAQVPKIKPFVQKTAKISVDTKKKLTVECPVLSDSIVVTKEKKENSDIYARKATRRGGNPYVVWVATDKLWKDPQRPKKTWGNFFKSQFLRIIRPPKNESKE